MKKRPRKLWMIGASQGIGKALAELLSRQGWELMLSSRRSESLEPVATSCNAQMITFDATDPQAMQQAAQQVFADFQPSYVLMNVGDYEPTALEDFDHKVYEYLNRTNYLSNVYLLEAVMPLMRAAGGGQVLLNISASSYRGLPKASQYGAPKAASLYLAESLRPELEAWNINLRVINPGFVKSRLTDKNTFDMPFLMTAEKAAEYIAPQLEKNYFDINFPKQTSWTMKWLRSLPDPIYFGLMRLWMPK